MYPDDDGMKTTAGAVPRPVVSTEDEQMAKELRERGKIAEDAARYHRQEAEVAQNVADSCHCALEQLLPRLEQKKMGTDVAEPERF